MADWYGSARTNYFQVKNENKFREWAESFGGLRVVNNDKGRVALFSKDFFGGWPSLSSNDEASDEEDDIDLVAEVAAHLKNGSVAVFIEVGAEKLRYLTGSAVAVNANGKRVEIYLNQIYDLAKALGKEVTLAEY